MQNTNGVRLKELLECVRGRHPSRADEIDVFIILHARKCGWPEWTESILPQVERLDPTAVGRALGLIAEQLTSMRSRYRCNEFGAYSQAAVDIAGSESALIEMADEGNWIEWAVDCLPKMWIEPDEAGNNSGCWIVWHHVWSHLSEYANRSCLYVSLVEKSCRDRVVFANLDESVATFGRQICVFFEKSRLDFTIPDEQRGDIAARQASSECAELPSMRADPIAQAVFLRKRKTITRSIQRKRNVKRKQVVTTPCC